MEKTTKAQVRLLLQDFRRILTILPISLYFWFLYVARREFKPQFTLFSHFQIICFLFKLYVVMEKIQRPANSLLTFRTFVL